MNRATLKDETFNQRVLGGRSLYKSCAGKEIFHGEGITRRRRKRPIQGRENELGGVSRASKSQTGRLNNRCHILTGYMLNIGTREARTSECVNRIIPARKDFIPAQQKPEFEGTDGKQK